MTKPLTTISVDADSSVQVEKLLPDRFWVPGFWDFLGIWALGHWDFHYHPPPVQNIAYIALGSNLGNRRQTLESALDHLRATPQIHLNQVSAFLENPAIGGPAGSPPFLNATAEIQTELDPHALLEKLLKIEQSLGRHRREKWGPRTIDLDLLLYENRIIHDLGLIVPHPLMHQRDFVLKPLSEIAPQAMHPLLKKTIAQLAGEL